MDGQLIQALVGVGRGAGCLLKRSRYSPPSQFNESVARFASVKVGTEGTDENNKYGLAGREPKPISGPLASGRSVRRPGPGCTTRDSAMLGASRIAFRRSLRLAPIGAYEMAAMALAMKARAVTAPAIVDRAAAISDHCLLFIVHPPSS